MPEDSNTFYIMATGPSINDITDKEWEYLEDKNTIAISKFPYSNKKTKYFLSLYGEDIDAEVLPSIAMNGYYDTTLLLYDLLSIRLAKLLGFKDIRKVQKGNYYFMPSKKPWFTDEPSPPNGLEETLAKGFRQPLFRFRGQTTAAINAALILGATEIRLCGVDLNNQWNFIDSNPNKWLNDEVIKFHYINTIIARTNKGLDEKTLKDYNKDTTHTTDTLQTEEKWGDRYIRGASDLYEWINKELGNKIFVCNKKSKLYGKLEYKRICDQ